MNAGRASLSIIYARSAARKQGGRLACMHRLIAIVYSADWEAEGDVEEVVEDVEWVEEVEGEEEEYWPIIKQLQQYLITMQPAQK